MWRSFLSSNLKQTVSSLIRTTHHGFRTETGVHCCFRRAGLREFSVQTPPPPTPPPPVTPSKTTKEKDGGSTSGEEQQPISFVEAKKLMRLVNVEALKRKLGMEKGEVIAYCDLIQACQSMGVARTADEAAAFVQVLDQAGVVLIFRDKVYLHPDKVVELVRRAVPLALTPDDDPRKDELKKLQRKKEEIDMVAHKQVRQILWSGLGISLLQVGLFFRLTFWEFSWDVMEPVAFFTTTTGLVVGYTYFLITSRDPTYQDLMKRLFLSRRRKLIKKNNFDIDRFVELEKHCKSPLDKGHLDAELEADVIQGNRPPTV